MAYMNTNKLHKNVTNLVPNLTHLRAHKKSNDDTVDCNNETISTDNLEEDDNEPDLTGKTVALAGAAGENC